MIIDYQNKARVLRSGLPTTYKVVSKSRFLHHHPEREVHGEFYTSWVCDGIEKIAMENYPDDWNESKKICHAEFERGRRLYHKIESIIVEQDAIWLTLTFTDKTLANTSADTRKQYVRKYLKATGAKFYIANVDYGKENDREHYHAIVSLPKVNYKPWHVYGAVKGEKISYTGVTSVQMGKYISKLTNHAIKETTKRCAIIYSR